MKQPQLRKMLLDEEPYLDRSKFEPGWGWTTWGKWPVSWVDHPERSLSAASVVVCYYARVRVAP